MPDYEEFELTLEIDEFLDEMASRADVWNPAWIAHSICDRHRGGLAFASDEDIARDREFWELGGYAHVRKRVTESINRRADPSGGSTTISGNFLPDFPREYVNDYYVVTRDGFRVGVPVFHMTNAELRGKIELYRSMGRSSLNHAAELERLMGWREHHFLYVPPDKQTGT